jgi:hypothetical protein
VFPGREARRAAALDAMQQSGGQAPVLREPWEE